VVGGQVGVGGESRADKVRKCALLRYAIPVSCCCVLCNISSMVYMYSLRPSTFCYVCMHRFGLFSLPSKDVLSEECKGLSYTHTRTHTHTHTHTQTRKHTMQGAKHMVVKRGETQAKRGEAQAQESKRVTITRPTPGAHFDSISIVNLSRFPFSLPIFP
jgi:hypothetical protein